MSTIHPPVQQAARAAAPATSKPTRIRYLMLVMLLLATILNYVDRSSLGIVAPYLSNDLGLEKVQMGELFAAFGVAYAVALMPGGALADILGSRLAYAISLIGWSFATLAQGFANTYQLLFGARMAIGALEAPAFPSNARAVTMWFPTQERGLATSVYVMGQYIGTPLFAGLLLWITHSFGWRSVFYATGVVGILFGLLWYATYRDPIKHKRVNEAELRHLREGGALMGDRKKEPFDWKMAFKLLSYRQVFAICLWENSSTTPSWCSSRPGS